MVVVPPALALRADIALGVLGLALVAAAMWAIVLGVRGRWSRARTLAGRTFWSPVLVQLLAWLAIPLAVVRHVVDAAPDGAVSQKARILAEDIFEGMNFTAPLLLVTPTAIVVWGLAVLRLRSAGKPPAAPR